MRNIRKSHQAFVRRSCLGTVLLSSVLLTACAPSFHPGAKRLAENVADEVGCDDLKSTVWTQLYELADDPRGFPKETGLRDALSEALGKRLGKRMSDENVARFVDETAKLYADVIAEATRETNGDRKAIMRELAAIELGDEETPEKASVQASVLGSLAALKGLAAQSGVACETPVKPPATTEPPADATPPPLSGDGGEGGEATPPKTPTTSADGALLDAWKANVAPQVYGAWKTMATAYQSCDAVSMPALDENTPDVKGITIRSQSTSSGGKWRVVTGLAAFLNSQPYLKSHATPDASCFDVEKKPLIYDFGGKPDYSSKLDSDLDLFSENGSGATDQLGVDCSGFVMTAFLSSGLKIKSDEPQRPQFAGAVPARNFMKPDGTMKKLNCFKYAEMKDATGIQPGDVLASETHVVMIDQVGDDPFGLARFASASDCTLANMKTSHFNFTIVQSGSTKGGIGISRNTASGYFDDSSAMGSALRSYALGACKAKFGQGASTPMPSTARIVRHTRAANCIDHEVPLTKSSCLKTCVASAPPL